MAALRTAIGIRLGIGCFIGLLMIGLYVLRPALLVQMDRHIYDLFLQQASGGQPSPVPVIVDLDEQSLKTYGQWPWPRYQLATLIKKTAEYGALAIGLDVLLAEKDRTSLGLLQKELQRDFNIELNITGLPDFLHDNDALLASIMQQSPVVAGMFLQFDPSQASPDTLTQLKGVGIAEQRKPEDIPANSHLLKAYGAVLPIDVLREVAPLGSINVAPDNDGIVRAVPLLSNVNNQIQPSLALRTLMRALGVSSLILQSSPDGLKSLRIGPFHVPVTPHGMFRVLFRGPHGTYPYFSAADILQGTVNPEDLQGRIVFIGTSASGLLDIRATPLDPIVPGVEVHAAVVDAILSKRFMEMPAWIPGAQVLAIAGTCFAGTLAFAMAPPFIYLPLAFLLAGGSLGASWLIFERGYFFSPQYVLLTIVMLAIGLLIVRFWQEIRQKRLLRQAFSRYVAPDLVKRIAERGNDILTGEERRVSLMFTDIRSFTSLSEKLQPEQVVTILNRYFTPMTAIIRNNAGTIDKFIGDAIMAFWNAPLDVEHHESKAIQSALLMQSALTELNTALFADYNITLAMGVGIHSGKVYVGNMGTQELLDYTCIGDTVNLASRLEGMCPVYGVDLVVSEDCVRQAQAQSLPGLTFLPLDTIRVKGKSMAVEIFTPLSEADASARQDELSQYHEGRTAYMRGDFHDARLHFAKLASMQPQVLLYQIYAQRCDTLLQNPPESWDGIWTYSKK